MQISHQVRLWNKRRKLGREKPQLYLFPEHKFGYIQIPKVASRSIRVAVTAHVSGTSPDQDFAKELVREYEARYASHLPQEQIAELSDQYFLFAFVRNPYDRIYSCYKNKIEDVRNHGGRNIFEKHGIGLDTSFEDFVRLVATMPDDKSDRHFRSQAWFLTWQNRLLPAFVGKLEHMNEDWQELQKRFNLEPPPQINASSKKTLPVMTTETRELIGQRYAEDFKLFGYDA